MHSMQPAGMLRLTERRCAGCGGRRRSATHRWHPASENYCNDQPCTPCMNRTITSNDAEQNVHCAARAAISLL